MNTEIENYAALEGASRGKCAPPIISMPTHILQFYRQGLQVESVPAGTHIGLQGWQLQELGEGAGHARWYFEDQDALIATDPGAGPNPYSLWNPDYPSKGQGHVNQGPAIWSSQQTAARRTWLVFNYIHWSNENPGFRRWGYITALNGRKICCLCVKYRLDAGPHGDWAWFFAFSRDVQDLQRMDVTVNTWVDEGD